MTKDAASLVAEAKQWAASYGDFANGEEGAALTAPLRFRAAWDDNDADTFAQVFVDNGSMLVGDTQLVSREEIRSYMAEAFRGGFKGTRLEEKALEVRLLNDSVAVAVTEGGIVRAGAGSIDPADLARSLWVLVKRDGGWHVVSHQTSPVKS